MTHKTDKLDLHTHMAHLVEANGLPARQPQNLTAGQLPAMADLLEALESPVRQKREAAVRALGETNLQAAAAALVKAMNDEDFGIAWMAANAMIKFGPIALEPLLEAMVEGNESVWFRQGAHRVIRAMANTRHLPYLMMVLRALESIEPEVSLPIAAHAALQGLHEA